MEFSSAFSRGTGLVQANENLHIPTLITVQVDVIKVKEPPHMQYKTARAVLQKLRANKLSKQTLLARATPLVH